MLQRLRDWGKRVLQRIQQAVTAVCTFVHKAVPGLFLATVGMDMALLQLGTGPVIAGTLSGIAACLSLVFILCGLPAQRRAQAIRFFARYGVHADIALTLLLTYIGFRVSVTLGLTALFIGLNLSGFMALMRYIHVWWG